MVWVYLICVEQLMDDKEIKDDVNVSRDMKSEVEKGVAFSSIVKTIEH